MPKLPKPPPGADAYAKWARQQHSDTFRAWAKSLHSDTFRAWAKSQQIAHASPAPKGKKKMGAPRDYPPRDVLRSIGVEVLKIGVDDTLDLFCDRVRHECDLRGIKLPRPPKNPKTRNRTIARAVRDLYWSAKTAAS